MMLRYLSLFIINILTLSSVCAQNNDPDKLFWSNNRKIVVSDFAIQTTDEESGSSSAILKSSMELKDLTFCVKTLIKK